jgi:formamidopyrimidine-DNA glycosylase
MIELPEALVIGQQMSETLRGKRIEHCVRGNAPHKFAFYNHEPEEYEAILRGQVMGASEEWGVHILSYVGDEHLLALGGGGERIFFHTSPKTLPKKYQFLLEFWDGTYLTVTIQMWGSLQLWTREDFPSHPYAGKRGVSPLSEAFTPQFFEGLFDSIPDGDPRAIKFFMISKPGVWGVGNGCLQDILFKAGIHPRRRTVELSPEERQALYQATRSVLGEAAALGGRDSELDLYGCAGRYHRILSSETAGLPCPVCRSTIQKISFLGGASYFCPKCQPL